MSVGRTETPCLVIREDTRPTSYRGDVGVCFYCPAKLGEEHTKDCVIPERRVRLRVTVEYETLVPRHWDDATVEHIRNNVNWCFGNAAGELQAFIDETPGECNVCCRPTRLEVVTPGAPGE